MQLRQLAIGLTAAIATASISQSAVWSFTANHSNSSIGVNQLAIEPATTGGAASQDVDAAVQENSDTKQPTVLKQTGVSTESEIKDPTTDSYRSISCQLIPQTSGGNAINQLNAVSKCNSGN